MKNLVMVIFCLSGIAAHSQSLERSVNATSGDYFYQAGTGSLSFTVGENAVTTLIAPGNILTQGFQQPDTSEISFVMENDIPVSITVFPNPVANFLTCRMNVAKNFHFTIYDEEGRLIDVPVISSEHELIFDVHLLSPGAYLISVKDARNKLQLSRKFVKM